MLAAGRLQRRVRRVAARLLHNLLEKRLGQFQTGGGMVTGPVESRRGQKQSCDTGRQQKRHREAERRAVRR